MYEYQQFVNWYSWSILIILYVLYSERGCCCIAQNYFAVACLYLMHRRHHLSLVMNGVKVTKEGQVWVPAVCQMVYLVFVDHTQCLVFRKRPLLQYPQSFCCCMFLFDR
jgi:hypothetical protein